MSELTLDIIRQLPKAELHCHLDGFTRPQTVLELAQEQGVQIPTTDLVELKRLLTVPPDCTDLVTYLKCFDLPCSVMQQPYAITRIFYEACEDAVKDGITYIELRFAPALHTANGHSYSQIIEAAIDGVNMAESRLPITAGIICCAMRHMPPEINAEIAEICWRFRHRHVVGFDIAGPENGFPPAKHVKAFRTIRQKNLAVTIHAGEAYGAESVAQALACSAQRIGHGTRTQEDPKLLQECIDRRIPFECCVTSNVQTQATHTLEEHPIKKYFEMGVRVVPCTDNPTVSGLTLSGEYETLVKTFHFTTAQIVRMMDYGFKSAFQPEAMRKRMRVEAFIKTIKILQQNKIDISEIIADAPYYATLGITVPPKFELGTKNPALTLELLESMPICDLDCRLIGSVPPALMYKFYTQLSEDEKGQFPKFESENCVKEWIAAQPKEDYFKAAKELVTSLLQTEQNIHEAVVGIIEEAKRDKVTYMELTLSPIYHTRKGLTTKQFLEIALKDCAEAQGIRVTVVINVNIENLNPFEVDQMADLAIEYYEKGVSGFSTTTLEVGEDHMRFYEPIFDKLRAAHVPVTMFAGEKSPQSVTCSLVRGGARRISGGFSIAQSESLLNDVTSHNVAVLCTLSHRSESNVTGWSKSPIRFFFDFGVKVVYSSIHNTFTLKSRSQQLFEIAEQSGFDALNVMKIISNSFSSTNLHYQEGNELEKVFWEESVAILKAHGFTNFINSTFFEA